MTDEHLPAIIPVVISKKTPELPPAVASLVADNQWNSGAGDYRGWSKPDRRKLHDGVVALLREEIPKAEERLKASGQPGRIGQGLLQLSLLFPRSASDNDATWGARFNAYANTLALYPEDMVYGVLNEAAKLFKWWPSLKELLDLIEPRLAQRKLALERMQDCLRVANSPPPLAAPPPETTEQRAAGADAAMAKYREHLAAIEADTRPKAGPSKVCRRYQVPTGAWPPDYVQEWIDGYRERMTKGAHADMPPSTRPWAQEGWICFVAVKAGELVLPASLEREINYTDEEK